MAKKKAKTKDGLSILQQRFVALLFTMPEVNQRQAYIQAGYKAKGSTADSNASTLLKIPKVQAYLESLRHRLTEKTLVDGVKVVRELGKLAFTNIMDYVWVDEDGNVKFLSFDTIDKDKLAAVESIKVRTTTTGTGKNQYTTETTEFKLCSKTSALDKLGKHFGIYEKDNEQKKQTIYDILAIVGINANGH